MPQGFHIGPLFIYYYGIILMTGALAGAWIATVEAKRRGLSVDFVWDGLIWVLIGGIIGARLWHIFTPPPSMVERGITTLYYLTHPLDAINIRNGGLGIPGAVIGGGLALYWFCKRHNLDFRLWADIATPGLALGQAIGRWGNFVNQELYGKPSSLPWAIRIDPQFRLPGYETVAFYHPLFLYESLWNLANVGLLLWLGRRHTNKLKPGDLFLVYLITYPFGRFLLEFLRLDPAQIAGVNANQTLMLVIALVSGGLLYWRHHQPAAPEVAEPTIVVEKAEEARDVQDTKVGDAEAEPVETEASEEPGVFEAKDAQASEGAEAKED